MRTKKQRMHEETLTAEGLPWASEDCPSEESDNEGTDLAADLRSENPIKKGKSWPSTDT